MRKNILWIFFCLLLCQCSLTQAIGQNDYVTRKTATEKQKKIYKKGNEQKNPEQVNKGFSE